MTTSGTVFSAAPSAAGYLYQARLALALCLRHAYGDAGIEVAVERLDDVSFETEGEARELLQTKHHLRRTANLGDLSPHLWKTLRIWSHLALEDPNLPNRTRLVLVTTGLARPDDATWLLRPHRGTGEPSVDNARIAAELLTAAAESSENQALQPAFKAFLSLTPRMRASLLSAVQVLDAQPLLTELDPIIEDQLKMAVPRGGTERARELLEGWWWPRICQALIENPPGTVSILEMENRIDEIRETLQRNALIADQEFAAPPEADLAAYEAYGFVRQLKAIGIGGNRIESAKRDFYRAFSQRSRWTREHVVFDGEISRFETTLLEEWEPRFNAMCDEHGTTDPDSPMLRQAGQDVYQWVETDARFPFRSLVKRFLNVGSFHMLANELRLGWHRDFVRLCRKDD
ncbi:hypothetical protein NKJ93_32215 [Mesorhizobium sp. M0028]|uniref:ABC-three component system protein n=1 Tax=Mesorhizobium sp. M0028 TaxID=2956849 RepID=UPI003338E1F0